MTSAQAAGLLWTVAAVFATAPVAHAATDAGVLSLSKQDARCIADNSAIFLAEPEDPVTVYLDICVGNKDLDGALLGSPRIELPDVPAQPSGTAAAAPKSVIISKAALHCLNTMAATAGFLDKDPVVLSVDACPK